MVYNKQGIQTSIAYCSQSNDEDKVKVRVQMTRSLINLSVAFERPIGTLSLHCTQRSKVMGGVYKWIYLTHDLKVKSNKAYAIVLDIVNM